MQADPLAAIVEQWNRERPDLDVSPMLVTSRLFRLADDLDRRLRPPFAAAGLGNGDFDVLAALRRSGDPYTLSAGELSRTVLVTTGAISKRVDRLEARGLVVRTVAESDSRSRRITLTPEGLTLTDDLIATHLTNQRQLLAALDPEDRAQLATLLARLATSLPPADTGDRRCAT
ncbi:MarR family transcriptional regulator [Streptomyces spiroverticillatus]|uniref:MarR family transcriptional regulator n=1 Tax=Streptomyces finlayi TaxID=67296 RepID=A0A918WVY5_9ACTN|nr:MarR family transcriptional regulator [Streptomyces finlayi]GHA05713.1 MarR family transcriptional regulator [Streptomyces spiroverticillatus]GHC89516.1 MarR family transcriptional regulator [Streptomyces finlayi]